MSEGGRKKGEGASPWMNVCSECGKRQRVRDGLCLLCLGMRFEEGSESLGSGESGVEHLRTSAVEEGYREIVAQRRLRAFCELVAYEGRWPDGSEVTSESVRVRAAKILRSGAGGRAVDRALGTGERGGGRELRIRLRLEGAPDPRVPVERQVALDRLMLEGPEEVSSGD